MTNARERLEIEIAAKDTASNVLKGVSKEASGLGKTLGTVGKIAGGFLAANVVAGAAQKLTGFIGDSIKAASALEQALGGTKAVFGEASAAVDAFAKTSAKSVGLSEAEFRDMSTLVGGQLKRMTGDINLAGKSSIKLTEIAADLAATYGGTTKDAMDAFAAALRGEADPAERFNLNLKVSAVNAKAVEMGLARTTTEVDDNARAQALLALITEQSADAQGQFARESNTASVMAQKEQANYENLQATLGTKLLPIQVAVTKAKIALADAVVTKVLPVLEQLWAKHWPAISKAIGEVTAFYKEHETVIKQVMAFLLDYIGARITGIIQFWEGLFAVIKNSIEFWQAVVRGDWSRAWEEAKEVVRGYVDIIIGLVKSTLGNLPELMLDLGKKAIQGFINGLMNIDVGKIASDIGGSLLDGLKGKLRIQSPSMEGAFIGEMFMQGVIDGTFGRLPDFRAVGDELVAESRAIGERAYRAMADAMAGPKFNPDKKLRPSDIEDMRDRGPVLGPYTPGMGGPAPQVVFNAPVTVNARDQADAMRSFGDAAWGLGMAMRARGAG